ncbi:OsmC family protein [Pelagimonas varians]|uniref:OsmC-like protein n=1 Tax=Pelagimonas varians TaxID=696760 RepID=A0A238K0M5_9RHOB|nr:OsmC family protein [Pelagimonas varians]PYG33040.1 putative OsmC-like protein [Pelagimonas varians]SMX35516.1 OsmC-like protein [Pelagimonas varians]
MAVKMKTVVTYRMKADCPSHARTEVAIRDLTCIVDEPVERGGTNLGASPTETAIASLIACTNVIGHKCAKRLGIDVGTLTIDTAAQFDRRGVLMEEEIDLPFPSITLTVRSDGPATAEDIALVGEETAKYCAIAKLFKAAGSDLTVNWIKVE